MDLSMALDAYHQFPNHIDKQIGMEREREAGALRAIENLMDTLKLTAEQAMAA